MSSTTPRPGERVRGSSTGRPIMALFDLVGRRWTLRIVFELRRSPDPLTFRALRDRCDGVSSSVLTRRVAELADARIIHHTGDGYTLTETGHRLVASMQPLFDWSREWADELSGYNESTPP